MRVYSCNEKQEAVMSRHKPSRAASQLQAVSKALIRERQVRAWAKELADKVATLQKQRQTAERELASIQEILDADPELTAVARRMMQKAAPAAGGRSAGVAIPNPRYVTADAKRELLTKILHDHRQENPEAQGMSYSAIRQVLQSRYGIETASAGLFFRNELKEWKSVGGNKNKSVVLKFG
jgi:hypothetical protein